MTLQEMFDTTIRFLQVQGGPSLMSTPERDESCAYRGENGRRCAVGFWIPDHLYRPSMEGQPVYSSVSEVISWPKGYEDEAMRLLFDLQTAHDDATRRHVEGEVLWDFADVKAGSLVFRLVQVAHKHGLNTSCLESLWPNAKLVSTPPAG